VTEENKIRYIHLVAFQKHTKELQLQAHAFKQGTNLDSRRTRRLSPGAQPPYG